MVSSLIVRNVLGPSEEQGPERGHQGKVRIGRGEAGVAAGRGDVDLRGLSAVVARRDVEATKGIGDNRTK